MITGAFKTTNIAAMEIKASIPPIDIWMDHRLKMEALCISSLPRDHPIVCHIYPNQRAQPQPISLPPLPLFNMSKRYRTNLNTKYMTCITRVSQRILEETEQIIPNTEPPWRPSEVDLDDRIRIFIPENLSGKSTKEEWADTHLEFMTEEEGNKDTLFIYSDRSLSER